MANISNFKRVQVLIKEKTSNKTILTIIAFLFSILILISSLSNDGNTNYLRVKLLDFSSYILNSFYMPSNTFRNSSENFNNILNVYNDNKDLMFENENLRSRIIENELIKAENIELKRLLNLSDEIDYSFKTVKIISQNNFSFINSLIILSGSKENISLNSPVVYKNNLIGFISDLGNSSSRVALLTDINSKTPAIILDKNIKIIISGNNNSLIEILNYGEINSLELGDKVYTSGDGNKYPKGLLIGSVVKNKEGSIFIKPMVDVTKLNYLQVIEWTPKARGIDIKFDSIVDN